MKERYYYSRPNRADSRAIELHQQRLGNQTVVQKRLGVSTPHEPELAVRRRRLIHELAGEIPGALSRLEEQDWLDAHLVIAGILRHKISLDLKSWDHNRVAVLTNKAERSAWPVGNVWAGSKYWLLSTGELGSSGTYTYNSHKLHPINFRISRMRRGDTEQALPHVAIHGEPGSDPTFLLRDGSGKVFAEDNVLLESIVDGVRGLGQ